MKRLGIIIGIGFLSGIIGAYVYQIIQPAPSSYSSNTSIASIPDASYTHYSSSVQSTPVDFVEASLKSTSSVVYIKTITETSYTQNNWWDWFFSNEGGTQPVVSSGSGVIYSANGYVVTNYHVVGNAEYTEVIFQKRSYKARVVGVDPSTDLAVLKIDATQLPAITLGISKNVQVGEWVIAVGNPFNLTSTVTAGIVSAKGRDINILKGQFPIESFIQTDAAINPGNSGGALVNTKGELIGINTAILSRTGAYNGYGFAIPVDIVKKVVDDILLYGEVQKAFIGADVVNIDDQLATQFKLTTYNGVMVSYVEKEGALEKAGIQKGDIILKIDNEPVYSTSEFNEKISYHHPGDKLQITYQRYDKLKDVQVVLTNQEGTTQLIKNKSTYNEFLGSDVEIVPKVERDRIGITHGIRIKKVKKGLLANLGIKEGFIVTDINQVKIETVNQFVQTLSQSKGRVIIEGIDDRGVKGYYSYYFR